MNRRMFLKASAFAAGMTLAGAALAQDTVKIGLVLPLTGPFASTGRQVEGGARLYMAEHGDTVAGKKIELIVRDDAANADQTKRLAQELIVRDGVDVIAGFGLTPLAMATAPLATEAEKAMVVMAAGTSVITEKSPFIARTSFTLPQSASVIGEWAAKNGISKVVTLVSDYAPGHDAEAAFTKFFTDNGGEVAEAVRVPLRDPDFAPFLQRVKDSKPDAVFVFVPSGAGAVFMKQFRERGLADDGIRIIGTGDLTDDDILNDMGDVALGTTTALFYSAAHPSEMNKAYVEAFKAANDGRRPNFMSVGGYDGMHLIYAALEKTGGDASGEVLIEAMKGMEWESPRGPISIDPETRDIVQNVYLREVEEQDGELYNVEFETYEAVKDPGKMK